MFNFIGLQGPNEDAFVYRTQTSMATETAVPFCQSSQEKPIL